MRKVLDKFGCLGESEKRLELGEQGQLLESKDLAKRIG